MIKELKYNFLFGMERDFTNCENFDMLMHKIIVKPVINEWCSYQRRFLYKEERIMKGIYALCRYKKDESHEIVYIGKSRDLLRRVTQHSSSNKKYDFCILYRVGVDVDSIEIDLIKKYKPEYNVAHKVPNHTATL